MDNIEFKNVLVEIISEIKDRPEYLASLNINDSNMHSEDFYKGMLQAYFFVMDGIIEYINCNDDISLKDVGLDDYDPMSIFENLPEGLG